MAKNRFFFLEILSVVGLISGTAMIFTAYAESVENKGVVERGPASDLATESSAPSIPAPVVDQCTLISYRAGSCYDRSRNRVQCPSTCYFPKRGLFFFGTRWGRARLDSDPVLPMTPMEVMSAEAAPRSDLPEIIQTAPREITSRGPSMACTVTTIAKNTRLCDITQGQPRSGSHRRTIMTQCRRGSSNPASVEHNLQTMSLCASGVRTTLENLLGFGPPAAACANVMDEALAGWTANIGGQSVRVLRRVEVTSSGEAPAGAICVENTARSCSSSGGYGHVEIKGSDGRFYSDFNQRRSQEGLSRVRRSSRLVQVSGPLTCRSTGRRSFQGRSGRWWCRVGGGSITTTYRHAGCFVFTDEAEALVENRRLTGLLDDVAPGSAYSECNRSSYNPDQGIDVDIGDDDETVDGEANDSQP